MLFKIIRISKIININRIKVTIKTKLFKIMINLIIRLINFKIRIFKIKIINLNILNSKINFENLNINNINFISL